jgi:hypothetical protein
MSGKLFPSSAMLYILAYLSFILGWFERIGDSVFLLGYVGAYSIIIRDPFFCKPATW